MLKPSYHKILIDRLHIILDEAAEEYDNDDGVVEDFETYLRDWANRRVEEKYNVNKRRIR